MWQVVMVAAVAVAVAVVAAALALTLVLVLVLVLVLDTIQCNAIQYRVLLSQHIAAAAGVLTSMTQELRFLLFFSLAYRVSVRMRVLVAIKRYNGCRRKACGSG
jgi:hypothetical protein